MHIQHIGKEKIFELGCLVRDDFLLFSSQIEHLAYEFYSKIIQLEKFKYPEKPYYSEEERKNRLALTALFRKSEVILRMYDR